MNCDEQLQGAPGLDSAAFDQVLNSMEVMNTDLSHEVFDVFEGDLLQDAQPSSTQDNMPITEATLITGLCHCNKLLTTIVTLSIEKMLLIC